MSGNTSFGLMEHSLPLFRLFSVSLSLSSMMSKFQLRPDCTIGYGFFHFNMISLYIYEPLINVLSTVRASVHWQDHDTNQIISFPPQAL